jgi:hypothetical protein
LLDALLDELAAIAADHEVELVVVAPAPMEGEFANPDDHAEAMSALLTVAADTLGATALSLADAPTTARYDGLHYAPAESMAVMAWLAAQL